MIRELDETTYTPVNARESSRLDFKPDFTYLTSFALVDISVSLADDWESILTS